MENQKSNSITFDYNNMMATHIGQEHGFQEKDLAMMTKSAKEAVAYIKNNRGRGMLGWVDLPHNQGSIVKDIISTAKRVRKMENFVVLGIGGSALGPSALFQSLCHMRHNELKRSKRKAPKFYVEDNVDPERMQSLLDILDLEKTVFNVITKSGSTSETMSQYLIIYDLLKKSLGDRAKDHIIATTDRENGNLIKLAKQEGFQTFFVPDTVGGRFSVISPVGLLPAAVLGIDIKQILKGCLDMDKKCRKSDLSTNPALISACLQYLSMNKGKNINVTMPYADSLRLIADWFCQLWGESLGKAKDNFGNTVNVGQTPVKALGVTDQHSQVQLYVEGPYDKVITFINVNEFRDTITIPSGCEEFPYVSFLSGHTLNELIRAEYIATEYALSKANRPNCTITLPKVTPYYIGQLIMFFMLQTSYVGYFLNINTFDQPGVEEGKNATYALLNREGYEEKARELRLRKNKLDKYIV